MIRKKSRLLVISHSPGLSGAERSLLETLALLSTHYELHLVLPGKGKLLERIKSSEDLKLSGLHLVRFYFDYAHTGTSLHRRLFWRICNQLAHRTVVNIAKRISPSAIYSNSVASWQGAACAQALSLPHIWHLRELILPSSIGDPLRTRCIQDRFLLADNTVFLSNSFYVAEWYKSHIGINPRVAYQPVMTHNSSSENSTQEINILSVGRLHVEKRHHVAIQAISRLPHGIKQRVRLEIFGAGPERQALQALIDRENLADNIKLRGFSLEIMDKLSRADIVLATSVGEPFGRVTAEALLMGRPVIGVASGGTEELLSNDRGHLVPVDNPAALAQAIEMVICNTREAKHRAEIAADWAQSEMNSERYLKIVCEEIDLAIALKDV